MNNQSCITVNSASDWLKSIDPKNLIDNSCNWPWKNIDVTQYLQYWDVYHHLTSYGDVFKGLFQIDYFLCFFGIVGNTLSLLTLCNGNFKQPSYIYHKGLAICDIVFNALFLIHAFCWLNNTWVEGYYWISVIRIIVKVSRFIIMFVINFVFYAYFLCYIYNQE